MGSEEEKVRRNPSAFIFAGIDGAHDGLLIDRVNTMFKEYHIHIDGFHRRN